MRVLGWTGFSIIPDQCEVKLPRQLDSFKPTDTLSQDPLSPIFIDLTLD